MTSNIEKETIIAQLFINKKQIRKLMDASHQEAVSVFNAVIDEIHAEGKKVYHCSKVPTARVVKLLEIDINSIHQNAQLERAQKKDAS